MRIRMRHSISWLEQHSAQLDKDAWPCQLQFLLVRRANGSQIYWLWQKISNVVPDSMHPLMSGQLFHQRRRIESRKSSHNQLRTDVSSFLMDATLLFLVT